MGQVGSAGLRLDPSFGFSYAELVTKAWPASGGPPGAGVLERVGPAQVSGPVRGPYKKWWWVKKGNNHSS